ncbi:MAG: uroporphyrinogen-III C-methyltransferase [Methylicorpusculum sp.]|uniref:uroporphyrinogen-III C-methyltransferase n=1 Tax=Methylicorpusculum sp. TaxID=2713644 RepID=UPI002728DD4C|nr:uroporphyrinogen-III C-methyltransferase [Methylicorpusculum sp.]MDO8845757.1 uroporphyrinogen-III C-methyltransferase [Methylicorpusculum sp.]MDO8941454.1 uroporphyrinogen-III C-methyltransferase [Methylicorpusculum sp.]MDP2204335.1 uroporphyrinogen-III C-methyltransferase [Methylicorpusculum sp.]
MAELSEKQDQNTDKVLLKSKSKSGLWFGFLILLIILSIGGIGYYFFMQLRAQQENLGGELDKGDMQVIELSKQLSGYQTQLSALQSQLATLVADVKNKDGQFNKTLSDFSQLHTEKLDNARTDLGNQIRQVQRQLGKTRGDWLIADAEYLLSVANQRLQLMGDLVTTSEALEAADQRLRESGDAAVFKVREQISKDIAALKTIVESDVVGIYSALQTLQGKAGQLPLIMPYAGKPFTPASEVHSHDDSGEDEHNILSFAMKKLEGVVTIRHTDKEIKAILEPEEALFIQQQLRVKLEMIKLALVQQNEALYKAAIADAIAWLKENFTMNDETKSVVGELERMNIIRLKSEFPDISRSLKMLRDITKLRIETDKALAEPEVTEQPPQNNQ